jgi:hypothetical protein
MSITREDKIRDRIRYREMANMYQWLNSRSRSPLEIIEMFISYMDNRHMLHSQMHADWMWESFEQLKRDVTRGGSGFEF